MRNKPESLEISEELWRELIKEIPNRITLLIDSSESLLNNGGKEAVCAGLYTYAVEEYGKLLLLKKCDPSSGKVNIRYKNGFIDHGEKFREAINQLPHKCTNLRMSVFDPRIFDPQIFDTKSVIADLDARVAIFYTDFTDSLSQIKSVPPIDKDKLQTAIDELRAIISTLNA
jgi:hypothetical protein